MKNKNAAQEIAVNNTDDMMPQESRGKKIANTVINVILVISIILAAVCTYVSFVSTSGNGVPSVLGARVFSIQTESMYPTLEPGDLILDKGIKDTADLEVGDIITYWTVINGERVLNTHRIVEIYDGGGHLIFETQGDNNTVSDPLTVHESEVVGQYTGKKIDGLGKVFDYLQTSTGFLIVVVIPVAIFFLYHLVQFFRVLFEYNNVKNKLLYEIERGKAEEVVAEDKKKKDETRKKERERLEKELRDKLKAELLAAKAEEAAAPVEETEPEVPEKTAEEIAAEARAALEAEIRAQVRAEMEAEAKAKAEADANA
ncbi:MAG: signal peptidase I [Oscillospiraceae bacterium]|nr:signal peptidase I [Oscillospiraceae bacterium]